MAGGVARAAVLVAPRTIEVRELPLPAIGPDEALLCIKACGICGTDYEQYEGDVPPHDTYTPLPVVPGHEPLGVIAETGDRPRGRWGVGAGDRVAVGGARDSARPEKRSMATEPSEIEMLDPIEPPAPVPAQLAPRLSTLEGTTIGLLENSKFNSGKRLDCGKFVSCSVIAFLSS